MKKKLVPQVVKTIGDFELAYEFLKGVYFKLSNRSYKKVKLSVFLEEIDNELNRIFGAFRDISKLDPNTEIGHRDNYYDYALDIVTYRLETETEALRRKQKTEKAKISRAKAKETTLRNKVEQYKKLEKELKLAGKI